jgi:hypothetical protein
LVKAITLAAGEGALVAAFFFFGGAERAGFGVTLGFAPDNKHSECMKIQEKKIKNQFSER